MAEEADRQPWATDDGIEAPATGIHSDIRALRPSLINEVFIASRFGEFEALRAQLRDRIQRHHSRLIRLVAVDLNDGQAAHRPPLAESLRCVRRADFMILLLGETYGEPVRGRKSFVHLEYEEALRSRTGTYVLAYGLGPSYRDKTLSSAPNPNLQALLKAVNGRHTIGLLDDALSPRELADHIYHNLLHALVDKHVGEMGEQLRYENARELSAELLGPIDDDELGEEAEVASLEEREAAGRGLELVDDHDQFKQPIDALLRPAEVAAIEQRREAQAAIALQEYGTAAVHLKRALRHRPLDLKSNYWLAQIYMGTGRKDRLEHARELSERAARVAERDGTRIRRSACLLLAARAARRAGDRKASLSLAEASVSAADHYARARMERVRARVTVDDIPGAIEDVRWLVRRYPRALAGAYGDPELAPIRRDIHRLSEGRRQTVLNAVRDWLVFEGRLGAREAPPPMPTGSEGLVRLGSIGRASIGRCYRRLCQLIATAYRASEELDPAMHDGRTSGSRYRQLGDRLLADRAEVDLLVAERTRAQSMSANAEKGVRSVRRGLMGSTLGASLFALLAALTMQDAGLRIIGILAVAALLAAALVKLVPKWRTLRNRARGAATELERVVDALSRREQSIEEATAQRTEIERRTHGAQAEVRWALAEFQRLLRSPVAGPFASVHAARPGSLVKVWPERIEDAAREIGRRIELVPDLPAWLDPAEDEAQPRIMRAVWSSRDGLRLEELAAYL
ncbi:MAG: DUF4062 domain-containing protein [Myxococcales bacterium]|nr:DUF4062 domain-containing protein [Myxococcales bacterium]